MFQLTGNYRGDGGWVGAAIDVRYGSGDPVNVTALLITDSDGGGDSELESVPATSGGVALSQWRVYTCDIVPGSNCTFGPWRNVP